AAAVGTKLEAEGAGQRGDVVLPCEGGGVVGLRHGASYGKRGAARPSIPSEPRSSTVKPHVQQPRTSRKASPIQAARRSAPRAWATPRPSGDFSPPRTTCAGVAARWILVICPRAGRPWRRGRRRAAKRDVRRGGSPGAPAPGWRRPRERTRGARTTDGSTEPD